MKKKTVKAQIVSNEQIAPDHFVIKLKESYLGKNSFPGQFVNVKVQEGTTDPLLRIPLGIYAIRKEGIHLLYKVVGEGTKMLSLKRKGEEIDILGPLGNGFDVEKKMSKAVIVAGGHGIAPLCFLRCSSL